MDTKIKILFNETYKIAKKVQELEQKKHQIDGKAKRYYIARIRI